MERTIQKSVVKDTSHPNFNIPAKKKRPKSTWCNGFILPKACNDMDRIEKDRMEVVRNYQHKLIKARS